MSGIAKREMGVLIGLLVVFGLLLYPALLHARRERRDGIRRDEVRNVKTALEMEFNKRERYPLEFEAGVHEYVVTEAGEGEALAWYVRARLENPGGNEAGFDDEYNVYYRVVNEGEATFFDICGGLSTCGVR